MPFKKLQVNKPVDIPNIPNATVPDAVARIGNLKLNADGALNVAIHYYATVEDADSDNQPIAFKTYENVDIPALNGFENAIIAWIKQKAEFDQATDI